ncbi:regulatory LuxR family protein [Pseudomonas tolaasii NCPPB 2192]|uniref:Regulatory LuxR family protein n=1 Tax=Pseudomonas tolaasii NCPPB 2192 TaxID=564423 RepID=A0ABX4QDJ9_PSETO|nr:LuxR C-terminal-related transcriptional regulator [Pseudomonas tolaasii]ARB29735.1 helix-turn-helix transcriptional regulator [Pseudomonas tolaasii]KAB0468491.1 helix-turn-helix transcriptional regulator [Pseudomonas tolaasii]PKA74884.1 regulatory LuxR family protein [Pseudomonas tolaasii NCPPB 2192]
MNAATSITNGNWTGHLGMGLALRELQCVLGIAMGQTSKELARDLGVQPESIKKRVLAASTKLGVTRRAQLVAEAMRLGVISPMVILLCMILTAQQASTEQFGRIRRPGERRIETRVAVRRIEAAQTA